MIENKKNIILCVGAILCVVMVGICFLWRVKFEQPGEVVRVIQPVHEDDGSPNDNAEIIIKDLILKEVEKHKGLEVVVNAREGKILNSTDKIECKNIDCALNDNDKKIADLKSDTALIHKTSKNVLLSGPTLGHFYDVKIDGQDISYNYSSQVLTTNKCVCYQHKYFSMSANKSLVDLKNSKITMSGGVESTILNGSTCNGNAD